MTTAAPIELGEPQRQSLWAVVFLAVRSLRQVGLLQIALFVGFIVARLPSVLVFIGLVAVVGVAMFFIAALQWWRYTFVVVDDELVVQRGVLQQQTLSIPLDRVQSVSLEQKLLHRVVSLVQVTVDTAGTQAAEFVIDAVDKPVAQALQQLAANHLSGAPPSPLIDEASDVPTMPAPPEQILVRHSFGGIIKIALTQVPFAGLVLIFPLMTLVDDIGSYFSIDAPQIDEPSPGRWLIALIPLVVLALLLVSVVLNLIRVALTEWDLTLRSTAAGLRRTAGLFSTTSIAVAVPRIQLIRTSQSLLERWASIQTIRLATIGTSNLVVPGCDVHQIADVRAVALAGSDGVTQLDRKVSATEVFLNTRNAAVGACLVVVGAYQGVGWWALGALIVVPWVWLQTKRSVRLRRWDITNEAIADRRELVGWRREELLLRKVNGVSIRQGLFERKRALATITFSTAAGSLSIGMIPHAQAIEMRDQALYLIETDHRTWM